MAARRSRWRREEHPNSIYHKRHQGVYLGFVEAVESNTYERQLGLASFKVTFNRTSPGRLSR
jgi:hypothetical protein